MPVKQYTGINRSAIILSFAMILGLITMVFLASRILSLAGDGELQVSTDNQFFSLPDAKQRAEDIAIRGPVSFPDASGRDRDIYVQHLGDDPETGWYVFGVRSVSAPLECVVVWDPTTQIFTDSCDGTEYPATGEGLPSYPITVTADGDLLIDINAADRAAAEAATNEGESD